MSTLTLDPDYQDRVFTELGSMDIQLDDDPLPFGPKRLNGKIAESRRLLSRCEALFIQVSQLLSQAKRELRRESLELDLSKKHLLANDPMVRAERSVSDRDAVATMRLQVKVNEVDRLEQLAQDLDDLLSVIKAKRADLRDIQGRLRDQIRLCQTELGLGDRWGSQMPGSRPLPQSALPADVDEMIANLGKDDTHLPIGETPDDAVDDEAELELLRASAKAALVPVVLAAPAPIVVEPMPEPVVVPMPEPVVVPTPELAPVVEPEVVEPEVVEKDGDSGSFSGLFDDLGEDVPPMDVALKATATQEATEGFLNDLSLEDPSKRGLRRRLQEEKDSLDIDDILSHFS